MSPIVITTLLFLLSLVIAFSIFAFISIGEGEKRAAKRGFLIAIVATIPLIFIFWLPSWFHWMLFLLFGTGILLFGILFFLPIGLMNPGLETPSNQVDERDIPFSRIQLRPGTKEYQSYYAMRPENRRQDEHIRELPGLLSLKGKFANRLAFAAADASFEFIETFRTEIERPHHDDPIHFFPQNMSFYVKQLAHYYGAHSVGITELKKHHIYSHVGRGTGEYGDPVHLPHAYAVAFTVEMNHTMIRSAPHAPVIMESGKQYVEAARVAMQLMSAISKLGHSARAHIDTNYRVIAPLVARDAGLGEIGRMGLLMTPDLGPRVRIGVVTTEMPLQTDHYQPNGSVLDFCRICKKCAENCPSQCIPYGDRQSIHGGLRWQIDAESCFEYWNIVGTDCGRCIAVCPYSHPDNFMHRIVRKAIDHSRFARRAALKMDDLFYGRKPEIFPLPDWLAQEKKDG